MKRDEDRVIKLMERIVALATIEEQRAFYDALSPADRQMMHDRGLKRRWRSKRASEAHRQRREQRAEEMEELAALPPDERRKRLHAKIQEQVKAKRPSLFEELAKLSPKEREERFESPFQPKRHPNRHRLDGGWRSDWEGP